MYRPFNRPFRHLGGMMGTNYYFKEGDEEIHIGKRHAAGPFCVECMVALHPIGNHRVHSTDELLNECPVCGRSADLVEYGMSFSWAITLEQFMKYRKMGYKIFNEYNREIEDFGGDVTGGCMIHFWDAIGKEFS